MGKIVVKEIPNQGYICKMEVDVFEYEILKKKNRI